MSLEGEGIQEGRLLKGVGPLGGGSGLRSITQSHTSSLYWREWEVSRIGDRHRWGGAHGGDGTDQGSNCSTCAERNVSGIRCLPPGERFGYGRRQSSGAIPGPILLKRIENRDRQPEEMGPQPPAPGRSPRPEHVLGQHCRSLVNAGAEAFGINSPRSVARPGTSRVTGRATGTPCTRHYVRS